MLDALPRCRVGLGGKRATMAAPVPLPPRMLADTHLRARVSGLGLNTVLVPLLLGLRPGLGLRQGLLVVRLGLPSLVAQHGLLLLLPMPPSASALSRRRAR